MDLDELFAHATEATALLKSLSHELRLVILCMLLDGEKSVGELEALIGQRQTAISQQLARLRDDELVTTRRDGKNIYYSLSKKEVRIVIEALNSAFCKKA